MTPFITVSGLRKSFVTPAGELEVLKGIDIDIAGGEMVGIVGASGAGKSTLLHILGTLDKPTTGTIAYHDGGVVDPFGLGNGELAAFRNRMIGFVFQFHYLLPEFTALENVMMPGLIARSYGSSGSGKSPAVLREEALALLDMVGLAARSGHKPGELSGGEQQRVAVARALVSGPRVVFADEPTGNLDTATGEEVFEHLLAINRQNGTTFVIVTHNESLSRRCHRVVEMRDGRLLNR